MVLITSCSLFSGNTCSNCFLQECICQRSEATPVAIHQSQQNIPPIKSEPNERAHVIFKFRLEIKPQNDVWILSTCSVGRGGEANVKLTKVLSLLRTKAEFGMGAWNCALHFVAFRGQKSSQKHQQFSRQPSLWLILWEKFLNFYFHFTPESELDMLFWNISFFSWFDRNILVTGWLILHGLPSQHWRNCLETIEKLQLVQVIKPKGDQRMTAVQNSSLVWSWAHTCLHLTGSTMLSHGLLLLVSKWLINASFSCFLREHLKLKWGFFLLQGVHADGLQVFFSLFLAFCRTIHGHLNALISRTEPSLTKPLIPSQSMILGSSVYVKQSPSAASREPPASNCTDGDNSSVTSLQSLVMSNRKRHRALWLWYNQPYLSISVNCSEQ